MRHSMAYQLTVHDYRGTTEDESCEGWQGWTSAMVDSDALTRSTVDGWPCPVCQRKGCRGEVRRFLPVLSFDLPTRWPVAA